MFIWKHARLCLTCIGSASYLRTAKEEERLEVLTIINRAKIENSRGAH